MKLKWNLTVLVFGLLLALLSRAQSLFELEAKTEVYQELVLPKEVFNVAEVRQGSYGLYLEHFSIVDKEGTPLPYAIYKQPVVAAPVQRSSIEFPVYKVETAEQKPVLFQGANLQIKGNRIDIQTAGDVVHDAIGRFSYLLDLREQNVDVQFLRIDWLESDAILNKWQIEASIDFQHWISLGQFDLVKAGNATSQLIQNEIPVQLEAKKYAFIKLTPIGDHSQSITRVEGIHEVQGNDLAATSEKWLVSGESKGIQASASRYRADKVLAWEYKRQENIPAESLSVYFGEQSYAGNISLYAKQTENAPWLPLYSGYWMNAQVGSVWKVTDPISLQNNAISYWRVELDQGAHVGELALQFSWEPLIIRTITNNKPPFQVVASREQAFDAQKLYHQLVGTDDKVWTRVALISKSEIHFQNKPEQHNWRIVLFWVGMILVVVVLALFSLKLLKQIKLNAN